MLQAAPRAAAGAAGLAARPLALARRLAERTAGRALDLSERALGAGLDAALDSPRTQRLLQRALDRPGMRRLIDSVIGSETSEYTVEQLLESEEMDTLVTEVARSRQVREALAAQTVGLASAVGSEVRTQAAAGDALAERIARRLVGLRRRATGAEPAATDAQRETR